MGLRFLLVFSVIFLQMSIANARPHTLLGFNRTLKDTQDSKGKVDDKPFSPKLAVGIRGSVSLLNSATFTPIRQRKKVREAEDSCIFPELGFPLS